MNMVAPGGVVVCAAVLVVGQVEDTFAQERDEAAVIFEQEIHCAHVHGYARTGRRVADQVHGYEIAALGLEDG